MAATEKLMHVGIDYGREHVAFEVQESSLVGVQRAPAAPALADPVAAVRAALETPLNWPPLRRALTPDDHVAIVIDEHLPQLGQLLTPLLEHLAEADISAAAVTLLCPSSSSRQAWVEDLPEAFEDVRIEAHDSRDRRKLSYLATTRHGRRIYLNRTAVDADQLIVFSGRGYDPILGYAGAETALYPALSDEATLAEVFAQQPSANAGTAHPEAVEVAWLLGAPFLLQVIEGAGDAICHVLGGSLDSSAEGQRLLDRRWRLQVDQPADLVIASVSGDPTRHDFATLARALSSAARVVQPGGRIVLLTQSRPQLGPGGEMILQAASSEQVLDQVQHQKGPERTAVFEWATAVQKAQVYLLSGLPGETAEDLFTTPLEQVGQAQRLLAVGGSCLFLPDAHKTRVAHG